jgi:hypothetical protein
MQKSKNREKVKNEGVKTVLCKIREIGGQIELNLATANISILPTIACTTT